MPLPNQKFRLPSPWSVAACTLEDSNGNQLTRTRSDSKGTRYRCAFNQSLDTNQIWRIELVLRNASNTTFGGRRLVHLSAGAGPQMITNQIGEVVGCSFDGELFSISGRSESYQPPSGWIATAATNATSGEPLPLARRFASGVSGPDEPFIQRWPPLQTACSKIVLDLEYVVSSTLRTRFHLNPKGAPLPGRWMENRSD